MILLQATTDVPQFFTLQSFTTLLGATGIVVTICGVIQGVFNFNPKWFALALSIVIAVTGSIIGKSEKEIIWQVIIGVLNGFLVYASATGANQMIGRAADAPKPPPTNPPAGGAPAANAHVVVKRGVFSPWW